MTSIKPIPTNAKFTIPKYRLAVSAGIAMCAILALAPNNFAQEVEKAKATSPTYGSKPWTEGTPESALNASKSGATIPLSTYSIVASKDGSRKARTGTIVGTSPFASTLSGSTINAVVVPIVFNIGSSMFDPTAPNTCPSENGASAQNQLMNSPLVVPVNNLTFNGVDVGNVQPTNGFMRAEFWNTIGANSASPYTNPISFSLAAPITMVTGTNGITTGTACNLMGVVSETWFTSQLASQMQTLTASGVISTSKFVLFLMNNVVLSQASPPTLPGTTTCCVKGYHGATGATPQFYAVADYNTTTGYFNAIDTMVASHEIAEFMNDPLGTNATPAWGGIGEVPAGSCQSNLEVGDPLAGVIGETITLNGYAYHLQEHAYFSWFFDSPTTTSLGAGGKFSSNGTFAGPSKACPPGGTF